MTVGSARPLEDAARIAWVELIARLVAVYGFDCWKAYQLLTQAGKIRVGNMADTNYSMLTKIENAGEPMRACEIHTAAAELIGEPIRWSSVKGILSAHTIGCDRRFRRIRRRCYELTSGFRGESSF